MLSKLSGWDARGNAALSRFLPAIAPGDAEAAQSLDAKVAAVPAPLPFVDAAVVLHVVGTSRADVITLSLDAAAGTVNVVVNDVATPVPLAGVVEVNVVTGTGKDTVSVNETVPGEFTLPITL